MSTNISRRNLLKSCSSVAVLPALPLGFLLPVNAMATESLSGELINRNLIGFHGQPIDPVLGIYRYGNGYRFYNPYLRRFQQFDMETSPFGEAGPNGYLFVSNDPFNRIDPDGRLDILGLIGGILSVIFSIAAFTATVLSGGLAAPTLAAALSTTTLLSGLVSGSTGIAAAVIDDPSHPAYGHLSKASSWSGLVVDVASVAIGGVGVMKSGTKAMGLASKANRTLGFSTQNMIQQISKAKWISKVEMGLETLDTIGTSMGLAASYQGNSTLSKVGIGFNIGANIGKLPFYSRVPARMVASKISSGLGRHSSKNFNSGKSSVDFLGKKLGSASDGQVALAKAGKETVRSTRIARNIVQKINMYAPTSVLRTGLIGPASINSELSSEIIEIGDFYSDLKRHEGWKGKGSENSGYGYGLEYLN
ncbi:RHS repeat-associated core domain-containing protein [Vibrio sp. TBV020]|uniref:RHS repeat-associated core domain-containing protein n=1 Tax=Vibrio sp. TBV020 TaxID=3137398 RepID=UPI0038CD650F